MLEYKPMKESFMLLKVKNNPFKHWLDTNGWELQGPCMMRLSLKQNLLLQKLIVLL